MISPVTGSIISMTSVIAFPFGQARPDPPLIRQSQLRTQAKTQKITGYYRMNKPVLITLNDLKALRPTAELDTVRWQPFAVEAQDQDLRPILGDGLFYQLMQTPSSAPYPNLLNGTTYTYNGQTIYFDGLKPMIGYFTLARLIQNNPINITRFGVVTKTVNQSQPVDAQVLRQVVNEMKSNAMTYKNQVDTFLLQNQTTYPLYIGSNSNINTSFRMFKG